MMDELAPGLAGQLVRFGAGFLVLVVALGALVTVLPIFLAGLRVVGLVLRGAFFFVPLLTKGLVALAAVSGTIAAPLVALLALVALVGGAAYTIWANWQEFQGFFSAMWGGLRAVLQGFIVFLGGVFSADMARMVAGLRLVWDGFAAFFGAIWDTMALVMDKWVEGASAWVSTKVQAVVEAFKRVWTDVRDWFAGLWDNIRLPTGPDLSRWSDRPSRISNEPVGAALRRRLAGGQAEVGPGAGDFVRAPAGGMMGQLAITVTATGGVEASIGAHSPWLDPRVRYDDADRVRRDRGPVSPLDRQ
jgi:hypothetical protein